MNTTDPFKDFDKTFDRAMKAGKTIAIVSVVGSLTVVGLIIWIVFHFLSKWW
jgi:hypothetical protein